VSSVNLSPLDEVAERVCVGYVGPSSEFFCEDGVPFLRTGNVGTKKLHLNDIKRVTPEFHSKQKKSTLKAGDVLVTRVVSDELKAAIVPPELAGGNCGNIIVVRPGKLLDSNYLMHLLSAPDSQKTLLGRQVGSAQSVINTAVLKSWQIPVLGLEEQRRIAAILDQAETLRTQRRQALAHLDTLTQSLFLDMFGDPVANPKGWSFVKLDQLIRDGDTINYGVIQPGDALDEGVPLVRVGDVVDGNFDPGALKRIDPTIEAAYKRSRLRGDEILVTCVGSIGVVGLVDSSMMGFNIARAVSRIPASDKVDRVFLASYLQTEHVQRYFTSELRTVSQPTLNIKQICETKVIQPPLTLQQTFATRIQAIEALKATHRTVLAQLDALFASLQQRAFAGEL
jgi:type I restriction enzyme, S subunit